MPFSRRNNAGTRDWRYNPSWVPGDVGPFYARISRHPSSAPECAWRAILVRQDRFPGGLNGTWRSNSADSWSCLKVFDVFRNRSQTGLSGFFCRHDESTDARNLWNLQTRQLWIHLIEIAPTLVTKYSTSSSLRKSSGGDVGSIPRRETGNSHVSSALNWEIRVDQTSVAWVEKKDTGQATQSSWETVCAGIHYFHISAGMCFTEAFQIARSGSFSTGIILRMAVPYFDSSIYGPKLEFRVLDDRRYLTRASK